MDDIRSKEKMSNDRRFSQSSRTRTNSPTKRKTDVTHVSSKASSSSSCSDSDLLTGVVVGAFLFG